MSWGDWYETLWDAIVALVRSVASLEDDHVFYGEKYPPDTFPSAFVCPGEATSSPKTFRELSWSPTFEIGIVTQNPITKTGMLEAWKIAGEIIDAHANDRTLGGVLHNSDATTIVPYWRGLGRGLETHWVGIIIHCERKM